MAPIQVNIKHAGRVHNVQLDTDLPPLVFKENVYQVTGVPVDRMKVMIKGGTLKVRLGPSIIIRISLFFFNFLARDRY